MANCTSTATTTSPAFSNLGICSLPIMMIPGTLYTIRPSKRKGELLTHIAENAQIAIGILLLNGRQVNTNERSTNIRWANVSNKRTRLHSSFQQLRRRSQFLGYSKHN